MLANASSLVRSNLFNSLFSKSDKESYYILMCHWPMSQMKSIFYSKSNYILLLHIEEKWNFYQSLKLLRYKLSFYTILLSLIWLERRCK